MSFGIQTFKTDGSLDFDSRNKQATRLIGVFRTEGTATFYPSLPGPYKVVLDRDYTYVDYKNGGIGVPIMNISSTINSVTITYINQSYSLRTPSRLLVFK